MPHTAVGLINLWIFDRKMRSDELLADPRAVVLTAPPGTDPVQHGGRGGRGRRGRGGRRGQGRRGGGGMDVD